MLDKHNFISYIDSHKTGGFMKAMVLMATRISVKTFKSY